MYGHTNVLSNLSFSLLTSSILCFNSSSNILISDSRLDIYNNTYSFIHYLITSACIINPIISNF